MAVMLLRSNRSIALSLVLILVSTYSATALVSEAYSTGDEWTYHLTTTMDDMIMGGTLHRTYAGTTARIVNGSSCEVYELRSEIELTISGSYEGYGVMGSVTATEIVYQDKEYLDTLVDDYDESMTMTVVGLGSVQVRIHNVSIYSPPGGIGEEPEQLDVGVTWTKTYTVRSEVTETYDGDLTSSSYTVSETYTYLITAREEVTVPAGTFDCEVLQVTDPDGVTTYWLSEETGSEVKLVYEGDSGYWAMAVLRSYSYASADEFGFDVVLLTVGMIAAVAVIVLVVVVLLLRKKKGPPKAQSPPPALPPPVT